ncbi:MAG: hypothetical protein SF123_20005 [Chloroflexota bacterium]|nr:hypothetical protein [Chloroflexota bacterium]
MAASFRLIEDGHAIYYSYSDPWTLEEALQVGEAVLPHYDVAPHHIHAIIDLRNAKSAPAGVLRTRNSPIVTHPKAGHLIVLGANSLLKTMGDVASRLSGYNRIMFCTTEEQAMAELRAVIVEEMASAS